MLDMTKGSPMRRILAFSIPALIGNVLNQVYSMTDSIIVGRILGMDALAAVGCTMPIVILMASLMIGVNVAVSILLSQAYGSHDTPRMRRVFANSLYMGLVVAAVMAVVGNLLAEPVLHLLGTPEGPFPDALSYIRVNFSTAICPLFYYILSCAYRGMGDSRTDLYWLIISVVANVFLDYLFVAELGWGVVGSAWATALAQFMSAVLAAIFLFIKYPEMRFQKGELKIELPILKHVTKMAIPISLQCAFGSLGNIVAQGAVNAFDSVVMAAYTAAGRVGSFALMPLETIGSSLSVFVGQNYDAKNGERIKEGCRVALKLELIVSVGLGAAMIVLGRPIAGLFLEERSEAMLRVSYQYLLITAVPGILAGIMFVYQQVLRGIGKTKESMYSGFVQLGVKILVVVVAFFTLRSTVAIWFAWPASYAAAAVVAVWIYRKKGAVVFDQEKV